MAAHRQIDGVYQWELSIPPASAAALLSAVCVNLDDPNAHYVGHVLLGPKTWQIRFFGNEFELRPLGPENHNFIYFRLKRGAIYSSKFGSRIVLQFDDNRRRYFPFLIAIATVMSAWCTVFFFSAFADYALWIRVTAASGMTGWFYFALLWLTPREPELMYVSFIEDLFADYLVNSSAAKPEPVPTPEKAAAK